MGEERQPMAGMFREMLLREGETVKKKWQWREKLATQCQYAEGVVVERLRTVGKGSCQLGASRQRGILLRNRGSGKRKWQPGAGRERERLTGG